MRTHLEGFSGSENITYCPHARDQMGTRGVSDSDVRLILEHGSRKPAGGYRMQYVLEPRPFAALDPTGALTRLVDRVVVVAPGGVIVTVYHIDDLERFHWCDVVA